MRPCGAAQDTSAPARFSRDSRVGELHPVPTHSNSREICQFWGVTIVILGCQLFSFQFWGCFPNSIFNSGVSRKILSILGCFLNLIFNSGVSRKKLLSVLGYQSSAACTSGVSTAKFAFRTVCALPLSFFNTRSHLRMFAHNSIICVHNGIIITHVYSLVFFSIQ